MSTITAAYGRVRVWVVHAERVDDLVHEGRSRAIPENVAVRDRQAGVVEVLRVGVTLGLLNLFGECDGLVVRRLGPGVQEVAHVGVRTT